LCFAPSSFGFFFSFSFDDIGAARRGAMHARQSPLRRWLSPSGHQSRIIFLPSHTPARVLLAYLSYTVATRSHAKSDTSGCAATQRVTRLVVQILFVRAFTASATEKNIPSVLKYKIF
jgi:hypothetical protein